MRNRWGRGERNTGGTIEFLTEQRWQMGEHKRKGDGAVGGSLMTSRHHEDQDTDLTAEKSATSNSYNFGVNI